MSSLPWTSYEAQASYEVNFRRTANFLAAKYFYIVDHLELISIRRNVLGYMLRFLFEAEVGEIC